MDPAFIIVSIIVILISLTFHEAAHATTANFLGDPTARRLGRMSLNPIMHIDLFGTILLPILLTISGAGAFGWAKPVPVDIRNLRNPVRDDAIIALAGPLSNLLLAFFSALLIRLLLTVAGDGSGALFFQYIIWILTISISINVFLMLFNMLPIPPLDGSSIIQLFLSPQASLKFMQLQQNSFPILFIIIFVFQNQLEKYYLQPLGNLFFLILYDIALISQ